MKSIRYCLLLLLALSSSISFASDTIVMMKPAPHDNHKIAYALELLRAALNASVAEFGDYQLNEVFSTGDSERAKRILLTRGQADITFAATSRRWEQACITIRIPIFKGLLGKRVLMIQQQDQSLFSNITSLNELKTLKLGSRKSWQITKVFQENGFDVVEGSGHWSMYNMLKKGRFDFLPRGVYEVEKEYNHISPKISNLVIEQTLLLNVPLPAYFFVNDKKTKIAKRLHYGLEKIAQNGKFDQIFNRHFGDTVNKLNLSTRKTFNLANGTLSAESAKTWLVIGRR